MNSQPIKRLLMIGLMSLLLISPLSFSATVQILTLSTLEDQWGDKKALNNGTKWVILSIDKAGGSLVKEALLALEMKDLVVHNLLYVADISAMPSFITNWIAIPRMQSLPFKIYLDKDGDTTKHWPRKEGYVSIFKLNKLNIKEVHYFNEVAKLKVFLKGI